MIAPHKERKNKAKRGQAGRGRKMLSPHWFLTKKKRGAGEGRRRGARGHWVLTQLVLSRLCSSVKFACFNARCTMASGPEVRRPCLGEPLVGTWP